MSYSKHKTEKYSNLKGINTKISLYTDTEEFRDLSNVNFAVPGALTKRPGTASYIGATVSGAITGLYEYEKLSGASYVIATANTNAYVVASPFTTIKASLQNGAIFDFVTFVDHLFAANGTDFFKFDGTNTSSYSLPAGLTGSWGVTAVIGGGLSGTFQAAYGYLNSRGYLGPMSQGITIALKRHHLWFHWLLWLNLPFWVWNHSHCFIPDQSTQYGSLWNDLRTVKYRKRYGHGFYSHVNFRQRQLVFHHGSEIHGDL
jgi:hypothetical protein